MPSNPPAWSPQQAVYRKLCKAISVAYGHDNAQLFWARHNIKVEMYKYHQDTPENHVPILLSCAAQCAIFVKEYMAPSEERIVAHNRAVKILPLRDAKQYHTDYLKREEDHYIWCRQRIRGMLAQRPKPPFPY